MLHGITASGFPIPEIVTDPLWDDVELLLGFDGTDGATTTTDESSSPKTVTLDSGAQISTTDPKFGTGCLLLDGVNGRVRVAASTLWNADNPFTVEAWIRPTSISGVKNIFSFRNDSSTSLANAWVVELNSGRLQMVWWSNTGTANVLAAASAPVPVGEYSHVRATLHGTGVVLHVNGQVVASGSNLSNRPSAGVSRTLKIGAATPAHPGEQAFAGRIDEVRFTRGARELGNFEVPTGPWPRG